MKEPRRVRLLALLVLLSLIGITFAVGNDKIKARTVQLAQDQEKARIELSSEQNKQQDMQAELAVAGTDEYIENKARTDYGYLKPGELRFVITNPEALYGSGDEVPQVQVAAGEDKP